MNILSKRNAVVGWAVLTVGKRVAKKKGKALMAKGGGKRKRIPLLAGLAALSGALFFWRKRKSGEGT